MCQLDMEDAMADGGAARAGVDIEAVRAALPGKLAGVFRFVPDAFGGLTLAHDAARASTMAVKEDVHDAVQALRARGFDALAWTWAEAFINAPAATARGFLDEQALPAAARRGVL